MNTDRSCRRVRRSPAADRRRARSLGLTLLLVVVAGIVATASAASGPAPIGLARNERSSLATAAAAVPGGPAHPDTSLVRATDRLTFEPAVDTVRAGGVVRWENASVLVHTVTGDPARARVPGSAKLPAGAMPFDSGNLEPGASYTHAFTVPGEYVYFCVPHEGARMRGTIVVLPEAGGHSE